MIPSPYEEHLGEVADPTSHEKEIFAANQLLQQFLEDLDDGRVPRVTLVDIGRATDVLGQYAGYPPDALYVGEFIESNQAKKSYQQVAQVLTTHVADMNAPIELRKVKIRSDQSHSRNETLEPKTDEDDIPF